MFEIQPASVVIAQTSDGGSIWLYPLAVIGYRLYGVPLGTTLRDVEDTPLSEGEFRAADLTNPVWRSLSGYGEVVEALASFFVATGVFTGTEAEAFRASAGRWPHASVDAPTPDEVSEAVRVAVRQANQIAEARFEAWKENAQEIAISYANNNSLCGEFDACMREIGLNGRQKEWRATYSICVEVPYDEDVSDYITELGYDMGSFTLESVEEL